MNRALVSRTVATCVLATLGASAQSPPAPSATVAAPAAPAPSATVTAPATSPAATPAPSATVAAPAPAAPPPAAPPPGAPAPYPYAPYYGYPYPYYAAPAQPPRELPREAGAPVPAGYHAESIVRRGPIIAGSIMAGVTYAINILVAASVDRSSKNDTRVTLLYIPGVGTWGLVGDACDGSSNGDACEIVLLHSLTHSAGIGLIILGIAAPRRVFVRNDASLSVVPVATRSVQGLGLLGAF